MTSYACTSDIIRMY